WSSGRRDARRRFSGGSRWLVPISASVRPHTAADSRRRGCCPHLRLWAAMAAAVSSPGAPGRGERRGAARGAIARGRRQRARAVLEVEEAHTAARQCVLAELL